MKEREKLALAKASGRSNDLGMKRLIVRLAIVAAAITAVPVLSGCYASGEAVVADVPMPSDAYYDSYYYRDGWVWSQGYWDWVDGRYLWRDGYWIRARPGFVYQQGYWWYGTTGWVWMRPRWVHHRRGYIWNRGRWSYRNGKPYWIRGHWLRRRPGQHYTPGRWYRHPSGRREWQRGHWDRRRHYAPAPRRPGSHGHRTPRPSRRTRPRR